MFGKSGQQVIIGYSSIVLIAFRFTHCTSKFAFTIYLTAILYRSLSCFKYTKSLLLSFLLFQCLADVPKEDKCNCEHKPVPDNFGLQQNMFKPVEIRFAT
jgi:hypothetical protein